MSWAARGLRLSAAAIVSAWEEGRRGTPLERALVVLRYAVREKQAALERWCIGRRDARLLDVRAATFGERLSGIVACPGCDEQLEVAFDVADIRNPHGDAAAVLELVAEAPAFRVAFRLPSSADLRVAAQCAGADAARRALAERCVVAAEHGSEPVAVQALPDAVIAAVEDAMASHDPQADVRLDMTCPACGEAWQVVFDIADFLWRELAAAARRLVADVHVLARAYGWREADVLALSDTRRQMYLDLVFG